jgi:hypothetical protein
MAGGSVVDVTPVEGGYDFVKDDGSSVFLLSTPETDDYAQRVSSLKSSGMTAGLGDYIGQSLVDTATSAGRGAPAAPPPSAADVGPNMSAPPPPAPAMSVAPPAAPPAPPVAPGGPTVPASAMGAPGGAPAPQPGIYDPASAAAIARMAAMRPGSPGISQAQLQRKAQQGVEMPSGTETVVEGALPYDEELAAQRAMATDAKRDAMAETTLDQRLALQAEEDQAQAQLQGLQQQFTPARQALKEIETRVAQEEGQYKALKTELQTGKVDPTRIFSGAKGTMVAIGSAIAAAMGAYGAILGRSNNFALDIINGAIERDVRSQEEEFSRKGQSANNMYRDLVNLYGDREQAKAALRGLHGEQAKLEATKLAARAKNTEAQNLLAQWMADDVFQEAETERKIRELSYGKHTQRVTSQVAYPQAGSGPSLDRRAYIDTYFRALDSQGKAATTEAGIAKDAAHAQKYQAEAAAAQAAATGGAPEDRRDYNKQVSAVDGAKAQIERFAKEHGYKIDPQTGKFEQTGDGFPLDLPDPTGGVIGDSQPVTKLHTDLTSMGVAFGRVANDGGEPSADLARRLMPQYGSTYAPNDLKAQLESQYQFLIEREKVIKAGATPGARATREQQRQNVNVENAAAATAGALPAPERY